MSFRIPILNSCYWSLLFWITLIIPSYAVDRFVDPLGMDSDECTDSSNPCQNIRYSIDQANSGDTIMLGPGVYTEADIVLAKNLTLLGDAADSAIVQAAESKGIATSRVFFIGAGVEVAFEEITIRYGKTADGVNPPSGGGIFNEGELTLRNCKVNQNMTGNGANGSNGGEGGGIFNAETGILTISNTTISGNTTGGGSAATQSFSGNGGDGGGIYNDGSISIMNSTISNNSTGSGFAGNPTGTSGGDGGGIYNESSGNITIINSTISNNATGFGGSFANGGKGGGIFNEGMMTLNHTTIANNETGIGGISGKAGNGAGVFNSNGTMTSTHTLFANNTALGNGDGPDCFGSLHSNGFNFIESADDCTIVENANSGTDLSGVDPMLNRLGDNGGPTATHSLLLGSPAIDKGDPNFSVPPEFDQRGEARIIGGRIDIGAFEFVVPPAFNLSLEKGWNLISIPLITSESTDQIFGDVILGKVWKWNVENQQLEIAIKLEAGFGYWVYSTNGSEMPLSIIGSGIGPADIPLENQWNLIGPSKAPPFNDEAIVFDEVLTPVSSVNEPIWMWTGSQFKVAKNFNLGKGYWVYRE